MAGIKIVDLPALGRDLVATDLLELSLAGGTGSRKITGQEIINASKLNVGTTPVINGTGGRIFFQGTGNVLQQSSSLSYDIANDRLIVGSTGSSGVIAFPTTTSGFSPIIQSQFGGNNIIFSIGGRNFTLNGGGGITTTFNTTITGSTGSAALIVAQGNSGWTPVADFNGSSGTALRVNTNGNVLIGTTTDAGFKLDVNGTARVQGNLTLGNASDVSLLFSGSNTLSISGGKINFNNNTSVATNFSVGTTSIGSTSKFTVGGTVNLAGTLGRAMTIDSTIVANANNAVLVGIDITPTFTNGAFTGVKNLSFRVGNSYGPYTSALNHGVELNTNVGISGSLDLGGDSSVLYLWRSGARGNGAVIGSTYESPNFGHIYFGTPPSKQMILSNATGNLLINTTTDAGFRLDVNGTARIQGNTTITGTLLYLSHTSIGLSGNVGTGVLELFNSSGSAGNTRISLGGTTYLNIFQPISASSGITSGPINTITTPITYSWASGTASPNLFQLNPNYNFTGTYSGTVRGFYYNPTLTSITGVTHFAFHSTSGRVRFEGLPTSPTGLNAGDIYNDGGTLKIV